MTGPVPEFGGFEEKGEDVHFLMIDEDGALISDAEWVARAEAGRPMRVRMVRLPPDPEEEQQ